MITLNVPPKITQEPKFQKFLTQYAIKKGFHVDNVLDLPTDLLSELLSGAIICYTAIELKPDSEFMINLTDELSLKCYKHSKYDIFLDLDYLKEAFDITDEELLEDIANPSNSRRLKPHEDFVHPLADSQEIDGQETVNGYGVATMLVNALRNPQSTHDNAEGAKDFFRRMVLNSSKVVNIEPLLLKVQAGYLREILEACTLINDGFQSTAEKYYS